MMMMTMMMMMMMMMMKYKDKGSPIFLKIMYINKDNKPNF